MQIRHRAQRSLLLSSSHSDSVSGSDQAVLGDRIVG
jgi:hypothetical protein